MSEFRVVIPARMGATRLPGKPLLDIAGVPMIVRVARQAARSGPREVIVATDDEVIRSTVGRAGYRAMLTRAEHRSGSDRVAEVAGREGWADEEVVINVQGDEPLLPPAVVRQLADAMLADPGMEVATLCEPVADARAVADPNSVKVVRDVRGNALYFSRALIPASKTLGSSAHPTGPWLRHIGIYGYRVGALRRFVALAPGALECAEGLEQLRLLEHGMRIVVLDACRPVPGGVDTAADLERVRGVLAGTATRRELSPRRPAR